jgi:hypothetical protein
VTTKRRSVIAGAVALAASARLGGAVRTGDQNVNDARPDVVLSAKLAVAGSQLTIDYVIDNRSQHTVYVFDRIALFRERGVVEVQEGAAWVFLAEPSDVRVVVGLIPDVPLKNIAKRPPNLASKVAARAVHRGTVRLPLPLLERHPFFVDADPAGATPLHVRQLRFQVGWVEERAGMQISEYPTRTGPELQVAGGWGKPVQWMLEQVFDVEDLAVVQHPAPFDRPRLLQ